MAITEAREKCSSTVVLYVVGALVHIQKVQKMHSKMQKIDAEAGNLVVNSSHWNEGWMSTLLPERWGFLHCLVAYINFITYMIILNGETRWIWRNCWGHQMLFNRWLRHVPGMSSLTQAIMGQPQINPYSFNSPQRNKVFLLHGDKVNFSQGCLQQWRAKCRSLYCQHLLTKLI